MKYTKEAKILNHEKIASDIFSMWIEDADIANAAVAGQFVSVYCRDKSRLLPRPISICEIDKDNARIRIVYRVVGKGTDEISTYKEGEIITVLGPIGNGYSYDDSKNPILIGGGIGIPPMLALAKAINDKERVTVVAGYRDELFLTEELSKYAKLVIATDDGSFGTHGTVIDAIKEQGVSGDGVFSCGPMPMLRAVKKFAEDENIPCQISLEERMACGIGACLGCVCKTKEVDHHTHVNNTRICTDGPVFNAEDVII